MGILDEAIREHLDLKRRRGADPSEVDRLEREALGPVRRSPEGLADSPIGPDSQAVLPEEEEPYSLEEEMPRWADPDDEPAPFDHASGPAAGALPAEDWAEPPTQISRLPAGEDLVPEPEPEPEQSYESPRHHEIAEEWEAHERGLAVEPQGFEPDEPAPAPPAPANVPPPAAAPDDSFFDGEPPRPAAPEHHDFDQETAEYRVEEELGPEAAEPSEDEDPLEETPDFLQDTPDHDRLWFEQRPPRDFDFDG